MDLANKNILVIGLGISGISNIKTIDALKGKIILVEDKNEKELEKQFNEIKDIKIEKYLGGNRPSLDNIDLVVKNPGVMPDNSIIVEAKEKNIEVVTDLELAYRLGLNDNLVIITGTNGKTTTTALVGEIFNKAKKKHILLEI